MAKLILNPPLERMAITQPFGADAVCIKIGGTDVMPKGGGCIAGYESLYKRFGLLGHNGVDFASGTGTYVYASHEGRINEVCPEKERGLGVGIITNNKYYYEGANCNFKTRYWHLLGYTVVMGQEVKVGDLIGIADNTGYSTGSHLHFEMKPLKDDGTNLLQNNGYFGAIDPMPYFQTMTLIPPLTKNLKKGMVDAEVGYLKKKLVVLGYMPQNLINDQLNTFGEQTRLYVLDFQRKNKICWLCLDKGKVGINTRNLINKLIEK